MRYKGSCPFCNLDKEDKNHILCCSNSEAVEVWKEGLSNLNSFLKRTKTDPWLRKIIIEELTSWHDFTTTDIKLYPSKYKKAILQQRQIGWKHFLEGLVGKELVTIQEEFYQMKRDKRTGTSWGKKLIKNAWSLIRLSWDKRNNKLHSPEIITKLEGFDALKLAIENEWQLGLHNLPPIEFSHLFNKYHTSEKHASH